jgi:3-isopropylmalate/(R)-2-methylmalate dehydratase small subunit
MNGLVNASGRLPSSCRADGRAVPGVTSAFTDGDTGTFDLAAGQWRNVTTGASGTVPVLPDLLLEIIASGGVLPRLAEQGYLPAEMADLLRSPAITAAGQGSGA